MSDLGSERGHRTLAITRKGGKRARAPLAPQTAEAIDADLAGREMAHSSSQPQGRRQDRHAAAKVVQRLARQAGIAKTISPHTMRHAFVTAALDAGASLRDVQDAAGMRIRGLRDVTTELGTRWTVIPPMRWLQD